MANIVGGVTSINNPKTDYNQTDPNKADYLKNKPLTDQIFDPKSENAQSGKAVAQAIPVLKGTAQGKGLITLNDVSPIPHSVSINGSGDNVFNATHDEFDLSPYNLTGKITISSILNYDMGELYGVNIYEKGKGADDDSGYLAGSSGADKVEYLPEYGEGWARLTYEYTIPSDRIIGVVYLEFMGLGREDTVYSTVIVESENEVDLTEVKITITDENGTEKESGYLDENGNYTATSVSPVMNISTNPSVSISAEYNRDIIKAITALENTVGLVNTTLASVVDVEK